MCTTTRRSQAVPLQKTNDVLNVINNVSTDVSRMRKLSSLLQHKLWLSVMVLNINQITEIMEFKNLPSVLFIAAFFAIPEYAKTLHSELIERKQFAPLLRKKPLILKPLLFLHNCG